MYKINSLINFSEIQLFRENINANKFIERKFIIEMKSFFNS